MQQKKDETRAQGGDTLVGRPLWQEQVEVR